jgi:hypothetical protein
MRGGEELKLLGLPADARAVAQAAQAPGEEPRPVGYFAPAISLALAGAKSEDLSLDFSHSRLAPPKARRLSRNAVIAIAIVLVAITLISMLYAQVNRRQNELDGINGKLKEMDQRSKTAQAMVDRVNYAKQYFEARPAMLEPLRQITSAFHDDEKIWVTTFNIHENGKGQLIGKAADQDTVLKLRDRLVKNPKFTEVGKQFDAHEADARTHEWMFSFNFTYKFSE